MPWGAELALLRSTLIAPVLRPGTVSSSYGLSCPQWTRAQAQPLLQDMQDGTPSSRGQTRDREVGRQAQGPTTAREAKILTPAVSSDTCNDRPRGWQVSDGDLVTEEPHTNMGTQSDAAQHPNPCPCPKQLSLPPSLAWGPSPTLLL